MGRRPNALILQWFDRGPKLADSSNRYPHTCKACGENFPKGRIDSLTNHLTKKCPAISESDRINACLTLHGINQAKHATQEKNQPIQANGPPIDLPVIQQNWGPLETLAEVSRQIGVNEKRNSDPAQASCIPPDRYENRQENAMVDMKGPPSSPDPAKDNIIERLQAALGAVDAAAAEPSSLPSMAAAATARLHPALLDPQLMSGEEVTATSAELTSPHPHPLTSPTAATTTSVAVPTSGDSLPNDTTPETHPTSPQPLSIVLPPAAPSLPQHSPPLPSAQVSQPWGEITNPSDPFQRIAPKPGLISQNVQLAMAKGGFRLEADGLNGSRSRHTRARFDPTRRKEVQEVRKIGACIRCRLLRKVCSKGDPCDTCRKVLSPRVWRAGCIRTKFSEQLDLYSAGVQIVLGQQRVNNLKATVALVNGGRTIEAYHFPELGTKLQLQVVQQSCPVDDEAGKAAQGGNGWPLSVAMLDNDTQDVPNRVEMYMREILPELIQREPSSFMRITLQTAQDIARSTNDELLCKVLELWGLVELLDRERQWVIRIKGDAGSEDYVFIREDNDQEVFTTICLQLAAAAERKAAATSRSLLTGMQRILQDSKAKIDFGMYFATLLLLGCVEKSTWAFKAWEQPNLRPLWPLEKEPSSFTQQGNVMAELLRMLLSIRKALPRTICRESDGMLVAEDQDPGIQRYFESLGLDFAQVKAKHEHINFSPTDSRSLEMLFCSTVLLPGTD